MRKNKKLTKEQREMAVKEYLETDKSITEIALKYGVTKQNIYNLVNAKKRADLKERYIK